MQHSKGRESKRELEKVVFFTSDKGGPHEKEESKGELEEVVLQESFNVENRLGKGQD